MTEPEIRHGIDGYELKLIAVVSMLFDHIGAILFPQIRLFRVIGRLAFPIYAFLLTEGFRHTKNRAGYLKRLFLFAFLSEIFFDLAFYGVLFEPGHQNIFFTLAISLFMMEKMKEREGSAKGFFWLLGAMVIAELLHTDYGCTGVLTVFLFDRFHDRRRIMTIGLCILYIALCGGIQSFAVLALIPIYFYNGQRGKSVKYVFYTFYPAHLAALSILKVVLEQMYGFQG